jgi:chemotaxis protein methyltransferase CheR
VTFSVGDLARLIEEASGFVIPERGYAALAAIAVERFTLHGIDGIDGYVALLRGRPDGDEWRYLLSRITIKESQLFRGRAQFDALTATIIPEIVGDPRTGCPLKVWCAGCARGEEAATLAIVLADHPLLRGREWSILATDVDEAALADAEPGFFGVRAVAEVPPAVLERHFVRRGELYEILPTLGRRIRFRRLNLTAPVLDLPEAPFDLVFLRNVMIYFRPEVQRRVVASVERVLAPTGWLFLGPSESLLPLGAELRPRNLGGCFCYGWSSGPTAPSTSTAPPQAAADAPEPVIVDEPQLPGNLPAHDHPLFEALVEEVIRTLESATPEGGRQAASELRIGYPESPIAHVLEGLAWARAGDPERALLSFRAARYLAPETAEIRYLIARVLDDLGRDERARREYRGVLAASERPAGGFWSAVARLGVPDLATMRVRSRALI